ncbi:MAG: PQQ-binding-like beta-propeller repeat protein [Chloroflexota bacterium]
MKSKIAYIPLVLLGLGILLTGCATGMTPSSWPGVAADAERAYIAFANHVYAVDLRDGDELWRFPEKANNAKLFFAPPVLTPDGQLIIGGYDHILYSLDPENGQVNWQFEGARDRWIGEVLVANDTIYAPNADYKMYALDLDGRLQWTFEADQSLWAAPVTDGEAIFFGALDHFVYALNASTGELIWKTELNGAVMGCPALSSEGLLYIGTFQHTLFALDSTRGNILWEFPTEGWLWSGPALNGENLYLGDSEGRFYAVNALDGSEAWEQRPNGPILGLPLFINETVIFGTESGTVYAFDMNGETIWDKTLPGQVYGPAIPAGELILIGQVGEQGTPILVALDQNGVQQWTFTPVK